MTVGDLRTHLEGRSVKEINETVSRANAVSRRDVHGGNSPGKRCCHTGPLEIPRSLVALSLRLLAAGLQLGETRRMILNRVAPVGEAERLACHSLPGIVDIRLRPGLGLGQFLGARQSVLGQRQQLLFLGQRSQVVTVPAVLALDASLDFRELGLSLGECQSGVHIVQLQQHLSLTNCFPYQGKGRADVS